MEVSENMRRIGGCYGISVPAGALGVTRYPRTLAPAPTVAPSRRVSDDRRRSGVVHWRVERGAVAVLAVLAAVGRAGSCVVALGVSVRFGCGRVRSGVQDLDGNLAAKPRRTPAAWCHRGMPRSGFRVTGRHARPRS